MFLKLADLEAIRDGRISLVFRRWSRPTPARPASQTVPSSTAGSPP
jgi:hypothetical protein